MRLLASATIMAALLFTSAAAGATGPASYWKTKDMTTALRAVGYPKPHAKKVTCKGVGAATNRQFLSFRCVAVYPSYRTVFYAAGRGQGGWICAGKKQAGCAVLKRGFVTTAAATRFGVGVAAVAASRGYMQNAFGIDQPAQVSPCQSVKPLVWTCGYNSGTGATVAVSVTLKPAKGGYVVAASTR